MEREPPFVKELQQQLEDPIFKRKLVLWMYYQQNQTQTAVSEQTGIPLSTVSAILKKWKDYGVIEDLPRSGRPKEISTEEENKIVERQREDRRLPATTIYKEMVASGHNISYGQTIAVINSNFVSVYAPYKIQITPLNKQKRVQWIESHQKWRDWKWEKVIWTDEKIFRTAPQNKKIRVKIEFDESPDDYNAPMVQQGGSGVMFWGAISSLGKIHFDILEGKVDSKVYSEFLRDSVLPVIRKKCGETFILQQDNAPAHKGKTIDLLVDMKVQILEWPAQSPDLNPIEQVWLWMDSKIKTKLFKNKAELKDYVFGLWDEIPESVIFSYINKVKSKMEWVYSNDGNLYPDRKTY